MKSITFNSGMLFFPDTVLAIIICSTLLLFCPLYLNAQTVGILEPKPERVFNHSLFTGDSVLVMTISGRLKKLFNDRNDDAKFYPFTLQYRNAESELISVKLEVKTRGHFRRLRENCKTPPLLLHFTKNEVPVKCIFKNQKWLKLVMPCVDDELVVREYLVYKLYNLLSVNSFKVRLLRLTFVDSLNKLKTETHFCYLNERHLQLNNKNGFQS